MSSLHENHPKIIARLKRAHGHLARVVNMLENNEPCTDIAQQLHAVEKAITSAKHVLIHDHIDHCLGNKDGSDTDLSDLKSISKFL